MTVVVRPVPKRTFQSGVRPFRVGVPANNIRPSTLKSYRPPVPEPLPPAPLLGPKELLGLGALVLAQIWGLLGTSTKPKPYQPTNDIAWTGSTGTVGAGGGEIDVYYGAAATSTNAAGDQCTSQSRPFGPDDYMGRVPYGPGQLPVASLEDACPCGFFGIRISVKNGAGVPQTLSRNGRGGVPPYVFSGWSYRLEFRSPLGAQSPASELLPAGELPSGFVRPEVDRETQPSPQPVRKTPLPVAPPMPAPQPAVTPVEPGPAKPAAPPITAPGPVRVPVRLPGGVAVGADGKLPAPKPGLVPTTHPDHHFPIPGAGPITGNGPQAKPEEIAKELGRLEQKLNAVLNPTPDTPIEWQRLLQDLIELITSITDGTSYAITEKCPPCGGGDYEPPRVQVNAPGALNAFGVITNRIDALAQLLDGQLGLKQQICPPCKPQLTGEWVSVNFVSEQASPGGEKPLRKKFRYRDQTFAPLEAHVDHWQGFEWEAGPVCVISKNLSWGVPQVWAATAAEGKRVISHAAQIAGINLADRRHAWIVTGSGDPRYGRTGRMRVDTRGGQFVRVTKRPGPSGLPTGVAPTP